MIAEDSVEESAWMTAASGLAGKRHRSPLSRPWKNSITAASQLEHRSPWASQPRWHGRRGAGRYFFNGLLGLGCEFAGQLLLSCPPPPPPPSDSPPGGRLP